MDFVFESIMRKTGTDVQEFRNLRFMGRTQVNDRSFTQRDSDTDEPQSMKTSRSFELKFFMGFIFYVEVGYVRLCQCLSPLLRPYSEVADGRPTVLPRPQELTSPYCTFFRLRHSQYWNLQGGSLFSFVLNRRQKLGKKNRKVGPSVGEL